MKDYIAMKDYIEMQKLSIIELKLHHNAKNNLFLIKIAMKCNLR